MNQIIVIFDYLKTGKTITSNEAWKKWGCTRLSDKILTLRKRGNIILSIPKEGLNRYGEKTRYVEYKLVQNFKEK